MSNQNNSNGPRSFYEEINVAGNQLVERVNELVGQGNIRRLILRDQHGRTLLEVPLTLGVVAGTGVAVFAPFMAVIGVFAALIAQVHIIIERYEDPADALKEEQHTVVEVKAAPTEDKTNL